jgi:hypothetical protein
VPDVWGRPQEIHYDGTWYAVGWAVVRAVCTEHCGGDGGAAHTATAGAQRYNPPARKETEGWPRGAGARSEGQIGAGARTEGQTGGAARSEGHPGAGARISRSIYIYIYLDLHARLNTFMNAVHPTILL